MSALRRNDLSWRKEDISYRWGTCCGEIAKVARSLDRQGEDLWKRRSGSKFIDDRDDELLLRSPYSVVIETQGYRIGEHVIQGRLAHCLPLKVSSHVRVFAESHLQNKIIQIRRIHRSQNSCISNAIQVETLLWETVHIGQKSPSTHCNCIARAVASA